MFIKTLIKKISNVFLLRRENLKDLAQLNLNQIELEPN